MQKLPENIDELEAFYKGELEELEVAPSPALWANISKNIPATPPPPSFPIKNWIIGSVSGVVALVGVYSYVQNQSKSQTISSTRKHEESPEVNSAKNIYYKDSSSINEISAKNNVVVAEKSIKEKEKVESRTEIPESIVNEVTPTSESQIASPATPEVPSEIIEKKDDLTEIEAIPAKSLENQHQVEKPHPSFFEKKASQVKDSARPLFIPKKK